MQEDYLPLKGRTVLVVDDNLDCLEATAYMIEAAFGCKALTASSCVEALALIDKGSHVDLLFSDVLLSGKDGLALARLARERLPELPVALTTGWDDEIDSIMERGYVALLKPYGVEQLAAVFTELLSDRPRAPSPAALPGNPDHAAPSIVPQPQSPGGKKPWHASHKYR
jgi:DNA-binding NtrC family response regulator